MIPSMPAPVSVHLHPTLLPPDRLDGSVAVMIDLLRASTTIIHALAAGCGRIHPRESVEAAKRTADSLVPQLACRSNGDSSSTEHPVLLAGERHGVRIDGFQLGNSPHDFTVERVQARDIVFTTTNGTAAIESCRGASAILVGALANLDAVAEEIVSHDAAVHLVCAGTDGQVSTEDVICAGAIAQALQDVGDFDIQGQDSARLAVATYHAVSDSDEALHRALCHSHGGRNLLALGFDEDVATASRRSTHSVVPVFDPTTNSIGPRA